MKHQQSLTPRYFNRKTQASTLLERVRFAKPNGSEFNETWLQNLLYNDPDLLPVIEIEPVFSGLIPLCREMRTAVGPLDLLFVNEAGLLTLVECKLWRNPEARRSVVGQILDYAQDLSRYDFEELDKRVRQARNDSRGLFEITSELSVDLDEPTFIDAIARNLRLGRFLLLVVGDGIREDVGNISAYLQEHATLNFCFGLVEQAIYSLGEDGYFIQPRLLAKTVEIERAVVRIEGSVQSQDATRSDSRTAPPHRQSKRFTVSEQVFFENLDASLPAVAKPLRDLARELEEIGIAAEGGQNSLILKSNEPTMNLLTIRSDGKWRNYGCGGSDVGKYYLRNLATLLGGDVFEANGRFQWTVKRKDGELFDLADLLAVRSEFLNLCADTVSKLQRHLSDSDS